VCRTSIAAQLGPPLCQRLEVIFSFAGNCATKEQSHCLRFRVYTDTGWRPMHQMHRNETCTEGERREVSTNISAILRRDAQKMGLDIDDDGWVMLSDLRSTKVLAGIAEAKLMTIIKQSNAQKPRYELKTTDGGGQAIRAISKRGTVAFSHVSGSLQSQLGERTVKVLVSGLTGPICEVVFSPNSSIIDLRKAISVAVGIPIQSQLLALGDTRLCDASAKLISSTTEQEIHVTCVRSTVDPADACTWCCQVLGVPVQLQCGCRNFYCVTCARDMHGMNGQPATCQQCPSCSRRLRTGISSAAQIYMKRVDLVAGLDEKYGPVQCPRGCGESYHRRRAQEHMDRCRCTRKACRDCGQTFAGSLSAHHAQCRMIFGRKPSAFAQGYLML